MKYNLMYMEYAKIYKQLADVNPKAINNTNRLTTTHGKNLQLPALLHHPSLFRGSQLLLLHSLTPLRNVPKGISKSSVVLVSHLSARTSRPVLQPHSVPFTLSYIGGSFLISLQAFLTSTLGRSISVVHSSIAFAPASSNSHSGTSGSPL
jgi:hypothetical protein